MARRLRIASAGVFRDRTRGITDCEGVAVFIVSEDLKGAPVHEVRLTTREAVSLIAGLSRSLSAVMDGERR